MKKYKLLASVLILVVTLTATVNADTLLKKGIKCNDVTLVQDFLKQLGYFTVEPTGYFGTITSNAVKKFQADKGLVADGIVGNNTYKSLYNCGYKSKTQANKSNDISISNKKAEMLDWWSAVDGVFPRNATALVTDVNTGKQFNIMRTYGTNHADCETLTAKDTKVMKDIWGGKWSWVRRPVVIETNGKKIAASIAAMPHAGLDSQPANKYISNRSGGYRRGQNLDKIKNNNMNGVFDVHFLNSRTHGTNKVDDNHQRCIKEAVQ